MEGAETKAQWVQRIYAAMEGILQRPCAHQIIVTHGDSLTFALTSWIRMPIESSDYAGFRGPPGSTTTLHEDDVFHDRQVVILCDTRHLDAVQR
ncbi:histidine phosphatase family protein [Streptomyces sp. NPDC055808]